MVNKHAKRLITMVLTAAVAAVPLFGCGAAQPMLNHSTYDTPNEESEIQRLCVYVETDHDTDGDGY